MKKYFYKYFLFLLIFIFIICFLFIPIFYSNNSVYSDEYYEQLILSGDGFFWPIPGYTYISSYFGKREVPTSRCF